jgi:uncharacterized cupin superfamily protein
MSDYTLKNLLDTEDDAAANGMGDILEAHFPRKALGCEMTGLSLQRFKPDQQLPFGHTHKTDEEIYVVLSGGGTVRVGDRTHALSPMDALRVAPGTMRAFASGPEGLELLVFGTHHDDDAVPSENPWAQDGDPLDGTS